MVPQGALKRPDYTRSVKATSKAKLTVSEKIIRIQHDHSLYKQGQGPTLELFFHELKRKKTVGHRIVNAVFTFFAGLTLILLYPFLAAAIKISSSGPVLVTIKSDGLAGRPFQRVAFRTRPPGAHSTKGNDHTRVSQLLVATGLCNLPAVINILRGDMNAVGPVAFNQKESTHWNNIFRDFYKRHAVKPGMIAVSNAGGHNKTEENVSTQLKKEFKFVANPRVKYELKALAGTF